MRSYLKIVYHMLWIGFVTNRKFFYETSFMFPRRPLRGRNLINFAKQMN